MLKICCKDLLESYIDMKVVIKFSLTVEEADLPISFLDDQYFAEVLRENIEDVFLGADISDFTIEDISVDVKGEWYSYEEEASREAVQWRYLDSLSHD